MCFLSQTYDLSDQHASKPVEQFSSKFESNKSAGKVARLLIA